MDGQGKCLQALPIPSFPTGLDKAHPRTAARRGKVSRGKALQFCQEAAEEPGEHLLPPAQSWPCHIGPREAGETEGGSGSTGGSSVSLQGGGEVKQLLHHSNTSSVPAVTDISLF